MKATNFATRETRRPVILSRPDGEGSLLTVPTRSFAVLRRLRMTTLAVAIALISTTAFAYTRELRANVPYRGGRVRIEHRFGEMHVHTGGNAVDVRGTIRSSDEAFGRQVRFNVSNDGRGVTIKSEIPERHNNGNSSWSFDLEVTVPANAPLSLGNAFGSIDADGLQAPAEVSNSQGSIDIHDARELKVTNRFGSVKVVNVHGNLTVDNGYGSVDVRDVTGNATLSASFGNTHFAEIAKNLNVNSRNGKVDGEGVGGTAAISGSFATIDVRRIGSNASIANQNGSIHVDTVGGSLSATTNFGSVIADHIRGPLSVANANGSVKASDIAGNAHVETSFASVFLHDVTGAVDVHNENGSIAVDGLRGGCNDVSLRTTFATIKVAIPHNQGWTVDARTSFGTINTAVPIAVRTRTEEHETGTINGGGCKLNLANANGSITIE